MTILDVENLTVEYITPYGIIKAVNNVSFSIDVGESVCLIGESGSGKSTIAQAILRTLPPNTKISGKILLDGINILEIDEKSLEMIRGSKISAVFQDPVASFSPFFKIGQHLMDIVRAKLGINDEKKAREMILDIFKRIKIPDPERVFNAYPHELSGGMLQRVAISAAIITRPKIVVADEPTSNLDVTVQLYILNLLKSLIKEYSTSLLFITHHLGVASYICNKFIILFKGFIVEYGDAQSIIKEPLHPYTYLLMNSVPRIRKHVEITGLNISTAYDSLNISGGCPYKFRCSYATNKCNDDIPLVRAKHNHYVRCILYGNRVT